MVHAPARLIVRMLLLSLIAGIPATAMAQLDGVLVDGEGVLRAHSFTDAGDTVRRKQIAAALAKLDQDIASRSDMRKVSINRLEAALEDALADGREPGEAMLYLAGLTRVEYVFYYPESKDIVIAGPAEGWTHDSAGRPVGIHTQRATLELQDLIVALRTHAPDKDRSPIITVSIEPTKNGLRNLQQFLGSLRGVRPQDIPQVATSIRSELGLQDIVVHGVSPKTHFAKVLIEADYRMKLIGIGLEKTPVRMATYVSKATPSSVARNALKRWYFVPDYECVKISEDGMAMQLQGDGVKLLGEDQLVAADGARRGGGSIDRASAIFTKSFTSKYAQLAAKSPVYAQMRNLIDLSVVAAFIRQQELPEKSEWEMSLFRDEQAYPVETFVAPQQAAAAVNVVWKGNVAMTPVGGGVNIQANRALSSENLMADDEAKVDQARQAIEPTKIAHDRWWWD